MTAAARARPDLAGPATALGIIAQLGVLRAVLDADGARAYFLGHPIPFLCGLHARTGIPCPMCGVTRAVAFALRGEVAQAMHLNPIAPIAVFGSLLFAVGLLTKAVADASSGSTLGARLAVGLRRATLAYAALGATVWLVAVVGRAAEALAVR